MVARVFFGYNVILHSKQLVEEVFEALDVVLLGLVAWLLVYEFGHAINRRACTGRSYSRENSSFELEAGVRSQWPGNVSEQSFGDVLVVPRLFDNC